MTNKEIANKLFSYIGEKSKFKPYDIQYGDTYFIFSGNPDSVIHFRIKGVSKQWKFGMWVNAEYIGDRQHSNEPVIQFFAQWEKDIDKFKPSRSDICVTIKACQFDDNGDIDFYFTDVIEALTMMKYHPVLCYCGVCGEQGVGYYTQRSFLWYFIKNQFYHIKSKIQKTVCTAIFLPVCKFKVYIAKKHRCVNFCEIFNHEKRYVGWSTSCDYQINCEFKKDASDQEMYQVARIFKKMRYGRYKYYQYVAEIFHFTKVGEDGGFTFDFKRQ